MHVYIYDDYLNNNRYNKVINRLEIRITDLGLNGKILRLGGIKNIKGAIQNEIKSGNQTFIAVGNNQTVNKIIGAIINTNSDDDFQKKILLGLIPIGNNNSIANSFGIKNELEACNILLARRIEKIDLGQAGEYYFLNEISIQSLNTILKIDNYSLELTRPGELKIINLLSDKHENIKSNPHDNLLDLIVKIKKKNETHLKINHVLISNPEQKLLIDKTIEVDTPIDVGIMKNKINIIVGKNRMFE